MPVTIDYRIVGAEGQGTWEAFLANLACRGLTGAALRLITTDGHAGLHAALALVFPHVPRQACWVHVLRNVAKRLRLLHKPLDTTTEWQRRSKHKGPRALPAGPSQPTAAA
jgi:transposase-like protein